MKDINEEGGVTVFKFVDLSNSYLLGQLQGVWQ